MICEKYENSNHSTAPCTLHLLPVQVVEYDLVGQCEARRHPVTSGPAWCLAIDKEARTLAVGTEEGSVYRLYKYTLKWTA